MSKIIKTKVGVICRSRLDNSRCHAKTEFNSYFIIHIRFIPTSYKFNYFDKILELLYFISKMFPLLLASAHCS